MKVENALLTDIPVIEAIYESARRYMRQNGNMHQWIGGYPQREIIEQDIKNGNLYKVIDNGEIAAVFCYFEGVDPTYNKIYEGNWLNDNPYGVIHRIAVASHRRGVASFCFEYCFNRSKNLKIDTHRDNAPMRNSLLKNGFVECGIIYLLNGDERIAYQKANFNKP